MIHELYIGDPNDDALAASERLAYQSMSPVERALNGAFRLSIQNAAQSLNIEVTDYDSLPESINNNYLVEASIAASQIIDKWCNNKTINERDAIDCYAAINLLVDESVLDEKTGNRLVTDLRSTLGLNINNN